MKAPIAINLVKFKKADFVSAVAVKTGMTKEQSKVALTAVLDVLAKQHQNQRVLFDPLQEEPQPLVGRGSSQSIAALHREIQILTEADVLHGGRDDSILSTKLIRIAPENSSF